MRKAIITTGLFGDKHLEVLLSVCGQMSDGIWENDESVEPYWANVDFKKNEIDDEIVMIVYFDEPTNTIGHLSILEIIKYFANKIIEVLQNEEEDYQYYEIKKEYLSYMGGHVITKITAADAYKTFNELMKRGKGE